MKKNIILIVALCMTNLFAIAQKRDMAVRQISGQQIAHIDKHEFTRKADELKNLIEQNKLDKADAKWDEIITLIGKDAEIDEEQQQKKQRLGLLRNGAVEDTHDKKKRLAINELYLLHTDMVKNKEGLHNKLREFSNMIN